MTFCEKEKQLIEGGVTAIDNTFIINYLPDAPDKCVAVYLLGLTLSQSNGTDNSCETIANRLGITEGDVIACYQYWDEMGLVHLTNDIPQRVIYLNARNSANAYKKIKPSKYTKFSKDIQSVITGRLINTNEYNEYYMFLENTTFETDALIAVAKYCVELKGNSVAYQYILTVARNLILRGATTLAVVQDNLNSKQKYDNDLKLVFKALGITRHFEHDDRVMYDKWTREFGFATDVIVAVAKSCKSGGMTKCDVKLTEYYKHNVLDAKEISDYESQKQFLYELARDINKTIGVYYQSLDMVVDEYVIKWLQKGYESETLLAMAKYCFRSNIRTLNGLNSVIDKLYKMGITTVNALDGYLDQLTQVDEQIKSLLVLAGLERKVTANDRLLYKTWTQTWEISNDLIQYACTLSAGTVAPLAYVNRVLADYKQNGVTTVAQAQARKVSSATQQTTATKVLVGNDETQRREYTDEQLNSLFSDLETMENK